MRSSKIKTDYILDEMSKFQFFLHILVVKHKIIPAAIYKITPNQLISRKDFLLIDLQDFHFHAYLFLIYINYILRFTIFRIHLFKLHLLY